MAFDELTNEQLMAIAGPPQGGGLDSLSNEQLIAIAGPPKDTSFLHELGAVGGRLVHGVSDMGTLIENLNPFQGLAHSAGLTEQPKVQQIAENVVPFDINQTPNTDLGKIAGGAAYYAPGIMSGGGVAPTLAAGTAAGVVDAAGGGPLAQAAAGIFGGGIPAFVKAGASKVGNTIASLRTLLSDEGAVNALSSALKNVVGESKDDVVRALSNAPTDELGALRTSAEVAQNPALASIEKGLGRASQEAADDLIARGAERNLIRQGLIAGDVPESVIAANESALGGTVRAGLEQQRDPVKEGLNVLYDAIDPEGTSAIPIDSIKRAFKIAEEKYIKPAGTPLPGVAKQTIAELFKKPAQQEASGLLDAYGRAIVPEIAENKTQPYKWFQQMRSRAFDNAGTLAQQGKNQPAAVMKAVGRAFDDAIENAAATGEGFTAEQQALAQAARKGYREFKTVYDKGAVGQVLAKDKFGGYRLNASTLPSKLFASPEAASQFTTAAKGAPEAIDAMRGYVVQNLQNKTPHKFLQWMKKEPQIEAILGKSHANDLKRVADDILSQQNVEKLWSATSRGQSITAQQNTALAVKQLALKQLGIINSLGQKTGAATGGAAGLSMGGPLGSTIGAFVGAKAGKGVEKIVENFSKRIDEKMLEAALDPKIAREFLLRPTTERVSNIYKTLFSDLAGSTTRSAASAVSAYAGREAGKELKELNPPESRILVKDKISDLFSPPAAEASMVLSSKPDLKRLLPAIRKVESGGNDKAVSPAGAKGPYQLMDALGKEYHRRLGIKDKYDPFNEPQAKKIASAFLTDLLAKYDDQKLAFVAYNLGETKLDKILKKTGAKSFEEIAGHVDLPVESARYVGKINKALRNLG